MFIAPTAREALKDVPPTIRVETHVDLFERRPNPENGSEEFTEAAQLALTEAKANGYEAISFEHVTQFVKNIDNDPICEYVWMFSAWEPSKGDGFPVASVTDVYIAAFEGERVAVIAEDVKATMTRVRQVGKLNLDPKSVRHTNGEERILFSSGGCIDFIPSSQPERLRGRTYDLVTFEPMTRDRTERAIEHAGPCVQAVNALAILK